MRGNGVKWLIVVSQRNIKPEDWNALKEFLHRRKIRHYVTVDHINDVSER